MALTSAQLATLKAAIAANGTLNAQPSDGTGLAFIADALNAVASPDFFVWRNNIPSSEIVAAITGSEFVALTAQKQQGLMLLLIPGTVDASSSNVQADFSAIFSAGTTLTALAALAHRKATVIEKMFATGTGTTGSPAVAVFTGTVTPNDVDKARRS